MNQRAFPAFRLYGIALVSMGLSSAVVANQHDGNHSIDVVEHLQPHGNVMVLESAHGTRDAGASMAEAFEGIVLVEPMEAGVRVFFELDGIDDPLVGAKPGDVIVGADPYCQVFSESCGLMGRLKADPEEVACPEKAVSSSRCMQFEFSHVGLESVIEQGALRIQVAMPIRSDDECFTEWLSTNSAEGGSLESASSELECANPQQGPLPRVPVSTPVASASFIPSPEPSMRRVADVSRSSSLCDEGGDWSRTLEMEDTTFQLLGGAIEFDTEYRAVLVLSETLRFDASGVDGEVSMALCQLGEAGVRFVSRPPETSIPLWVRGSGPHFVPLGWLPLVYTTTARLDLRLTGEAGVQISPLVTFRGEQDHDVDFADSVSRDGGSKSSHFHITPGDLADANAEITASASLLPALQVNLYGAAGPFAGAELTLNGVSHLAGSGGMAVGAELSSTLTAGVSERVTDRRWSHSWAVTRCGVGDLPDRSVPPCRDEGAADGVQQALFTR